MNASAIARMTLVSAALLSAATSSIAGHYIYGEVRESVQLKDGATLHVFTDGKMAKESKFGHPVWMRSGDVVEASDGRRITVVGNEVARLEGLIRKEHGGGN